MPGRARAYQVRLRPKTTRPTKSGYGDWSHRRLRCGISGCAARAGLSSRGSSYTSWHEAGGCYGALGRRFSRIPTAPSRLSATALASLVHGDPVKRGVLSARQDVPPAPPAKNLHGASRDRGFESRCSSGESTNYGFLGGGGASAVCSAVPNVRIHLPSGGSSANYHSFCHGHWMVNPSEPDPSPGV